jgi:hypothetical protein
MSDNPVFISRLHGDCYGDAFRSLCKKAGVPTADVRGNITSVSLLQDTSFRYGRLLGSWPETGLEEINFDLLESDFGGLVSGYPVRTKPLARRTLPRG